jgi:hypothetical protein
VEVRSTVKRAEKNNGIAVHAWEHGHRMDWENARVLSILEENIRSN